MSQENVELVMLLQPGPGEDLVPRLRDEVEIQTTLALAAEYFHPDVETVHRMLGAERTYVGIGGLFESWRDWLVPWVSYRSDVVEAIDCGERVLMIVDDYGRQAGSAVEVKSNNAAIWTIRDRLVVRAEFYVDRERARTDAGLAP